MGSLPALGLYRILAKRSFMCTAVGGVFQDVLTSSDMWSGGCSRYSGCGCMPYSPPCACKDGADCTVWAGRAG